jgi:hypothetical protein
LESNKNSRKVNCDIDFTWVAGPANRRLAVAGSCDVRYSNSAKRQAKSRQAGRLFAQTLSHWWMRGTASVAFGGFSGSIGQVRISTIVELNRGFFGVDALNGSRTIAKQL